VDEVTLKQGFLPVLRFYCFAYHHSTIPPFSPVTAASVCDSLDQAAQHCVVYPQLSSFISDPALRWPQRNGRFVLDIG
jgi:hypothetical protein